jgi:multiple sugar transport system permease protein
VSPTLGASDVTIRGRPRLNVAYLFLAPSAIVLLIFTVWPIAQAFWMSLHDWSFLSQSRPFTGAANYNALLSDRRFWNALVNTAVYTLGAVPFQIGLALALAIGLNARLRGRAFLRAAYFVPVISSLAIMAIVWAALFDPDIGLVSSWMASFGLPRVAWLREPGTAMFAVIVVGVWKTLGFNTVILLAGLQGIPGEHYEAASIDGASAWQRFRHITVPGLRQTLLFVTVISVIASLQVFDQVYVMTRGGPLFATETLVTYVYHQGFTLFQMGYASAISWVLFLIIAAVSVVQLRLFRYQEVD